MDIQSRDNRFSYRLARYSFLYSLGLYLRLISTKKIEKNRGACFMLCAMMALSPRVLRPTSPYQLWRMYRCSLLWAVRCILIIRSHGTMHKNEVKKMTGSQASNIINKIQPYMCARGCVAVGCSHRHQKAKSKKPPSHHRPPAPLTYPLPPAAGEIAKFKKRPARGRAAPGTGRAPSNNKKALYPFFLVESGFLERSGSVWFEMQCSM